MVAPNPTLRTQHVGDSRFHCVQDTMSFLKDREIWIPAVTALNLRVARGWCQWGASVLVVVVVVVLLLLVSGSIVIDNRD